MDEIPRDQLTGALRRGAVKKHVAAIHVSGKLTLLQRKLSNVLLLNAYDTLISRTRHQIDARTLCLMIGYNSNDIDTLKQSLKGLAETVAEWDMLDTPHSCCPRSSSISHSATVSASPFSDCFSVSRSFEL